MRWMVFNILSLPWNLETAAQWQDRRVASLRSAASAKLLKCQIVHSNCGNGPFKSEKDTSSKPSNTVCCKKKKHRIIWPSAKYKLDWMPNSSSKLGETQLPVLHWIKTLWAVLVLNRSEHVQFPNLLLRNGSCPVNVPPRIRFPYISLPWVVNILIWP